MKTKTMMRMLGLALGLTFSLPTGTALAQGTAFTYQGMLHDGGNPAHGRYDFRVQLYNRATAGEPGDALIGPTLEFTDVTVSHGLFVLPLDFGGSPFAGEARWLAFTVRTNGGSPYVVLQPRQPLTAAPYAITAERISGSLPASQLTGTVASGQLGGTYAGAVTFNNTGNAFTGDGSGLTGVNAATVGGVSGADLWKLSGNSGVGAGQFLGTTDDQPLEFRVNGVRALRLEPGVSGWPNVIGGATNNTVERANGATISGGWGHTIQTNAWASTIAGGYNNTIQTNAYTATIGGGRDNTIQADAWASTIGGGSGNTIQPDAWASTIGGGRGNTIQTNAGYPTIGGGWDNTIQTGAWYSTIGGGYWNTIQTNAWDSTIAGGGNNTIQANAVSATIPGGYLNEAAGEYSFAAGLRAKANHDGAFVWADSQNADFLSTTTNEFNIRAQNGVRIQADKGIHLHAANAPIIVRDWDVFAASAGDLKAGIGRWGLFMEPFTLTLGIPGDDVPGRLFRVSKYNPDGSAVPLMTVNQAGVVTAQSFNPSSDRQLKENFAAVSPEEVLAKVAALPISRWNFKGEAETPHLGPMAQDFHAAFGLGTDDKHIATVDADGVALAAIQGLNRKLEQKETEITELKEQLAALQEVVNRLVTQHDESGQ